jgi:hypothetical protein
MSNDKCIGYGGPHCSCGNHKDDPYHMDYYWQPAYIHKNMNDRYCCIKCNWSAEIKPILEHIKKDIDESQAEADVIKQEVSKQEPDNGE